MSGKLQENMQAELLTLKADLCAARESAELHNSRVSTLEREERALEAALAILAGREIIASEGYPGPPMDRAVILAALSKMAPSVAAVNAANAEPSEQGGAGPLGLKPKTEIKFDLPEGWTKSTLNGEEILLEPGMTVMKNSFGEEVIAKVGTKFASMAEPVKPEGHADLLPPIAEQEGFDSPEEMLDG